MKLSPQLLSHMIFIIGMIIILIFGVLKAREKGKKWLFAHRGLAISGVSCGIVGFLIMATFKFVKGYSHFGTPHSKGGLIALVLLICTPIFGYLVTKQKMQLKKVHRLLGYITVTFTILSAIFGTMIVFGK